MNRQNPSSERRWEKTPQRLNTDEEEDEDLGWPPSGEAEMWRRFVAKNDRRALRFTAQRTDSVWLAEGRQENEWTRVMMSVLSVEVTSSDPGKHAEWARIGGTVCS